MHSSVSDAHSFPVRHDDHHEFVPKAVVFGAPLSEVELGEEAVPVCLDSMFHYLITRGFFMWPKACFFFG